MFRSLITLAATVVCSLAMAKSPAAPKSAAPTTTRVNIDTAKSTINWKGTKAFVGDHHTGTVSLSGGHLMLDGEKITGGEVVIDMTTIKNTDLKDASMVGKLEGHLKADDFFAVDKNKTATFTIKEVKPAAGGNQELIGNATIRGVTQPMKITANIKKDGTVWVASGKTEFDRTKFGVKYNSKDFFPDMIKSAKDKVINNEIQLEFNLKTM